MDALTCSIPHTDTGIGVESGGGVPVTGFDPVAVVGLVSGFDPSGLDADSLLTVLAGLERVVAAAHAAQVTALAEFTR
ncbi:MAG TPA: hypothetical protein VFX70_06120, partial [Mycobacteriales bacterium]|nr:hypothetical protein [Mycobacteriales bacterium]